MKQEKNKKSLDVIMIIILIIGAILLIRGLFYEIPSREFSFYDIKEYVGGDAYNGIIESSIKGGEISGATSAKSIYICSGIITTTLGLLKVKPKK